MAAGPMDWSLVDGAVPLVVQILGALALAALLLSRDLRWWTRLLPLAVVTAALLTVLVKFTVDDWWQPFPDELPGDVMVWLGVAILGVCLALFRLPTLRLRGRAGALVAGALVVALGLSEVNIHYDNYPTLRTMLGPQDTVSLKDATGGREPMVDVPPGKALSEVWRAPARMPAKGTVSTASVPGTKSGFKARDAYVYLPPAYQHLTPPAAARPGADGRPAGGSPQDWITSGQLAGHAWTTSPPGTPVWRPVVLVVDPLGSPLRQPAVHGPRARQGPDDLAEDVPDWARPPILQTATDRSPSGRSPGSPTAAPAPCSWPSTRPVRLRHLPRHLRPGRADARQARKKTVDAAFGGDEAAFEKVNPVDVMARSDVPRHLRGDRSPGPTTRRTGRRR